MSSAPTQAALRSQWAITLDGHAVTHNIHDQFTSATASTINATVAITVTTLYIRSQNAAHTLNTIGVISDRFGVRVFDPGSVNFSGSGDNTRRPRRR